MVLLGFEVGAVVVATFWVWGLARFKECAFIVSGFRVGGPTVYMTVHLCFLVPWHSSIDPNENPTKTDAGFDGSKS